MGISGLLSVLKPVTKNDHISSYRGKTIGVDTYCWLHKAVYSCSMELCQGVQTDKYIRYCFEMVDLLLYHGVTPFLVFDGSYLPAKAGKEAERKQRREENFACAKQCLKAGDLSNARSFFTKAVEVTPFMAYRLIAALRRERPKVRFVVAPYEADAQLGFLCRSEQIAAVITEDSDTLLFGCSTVLFKMDRQTGSVQSVKTEDIFSVPVTSFLDFRDFTQEMFLWMCILSGCDYLASVKGVGLKKAYNLVRRHRNLDRLLRALRFEMGLAVPSSYEKDFRLAMLTFHHQTVFDVERRTLTPLLPFDSALEEGDTDYVGPAKEDQIAAQIADAQIDPITHESFSSMTQNDTQKSSSTMKNFKTDSSKFTKMPIFQKNTLDSYFEASAKRKEKKPSERRNCSRNEKILKSALTAASTRNSAGSDPCSPESFQFQPLEHGDQESKCQAQASTTDVMVSPTSFYSFAFSSTCTSDKDEACDTVDDHKHEEGTSTDIFSTQTDSQLESISSTQSDQHSEQESLDVISNAKRSNTATGENPLTESKHFQQMFSSVPRNISGLRAGKIRRRKSLESGTTTAKESADRRATKSFGGFESSKKENLEAGCIRKRRRSLGGRATKPTLLSRPLLSFNYSPKNEVSSQGHRSSLVPDFTDPIRSPRCSSPDDECNKENVFHVRDESAQGHLKLVNCVASPNKDDHTSPEKKKTKTKVGAFLSRFTFKKKSTQEEGTPGPQQANRNIQEERGQDASKRKSIASKSPASKKKLSRGEEAINGRPSTNGGSKVNFLDFVYKVPL